MDFSQFDNRVAAEAGHRYVFCHPETREPLGEGDIAPAVIVRGAASKTAQTRLRELQKKRKGKRNEQQIMEDIHETLIEAAAPYIVRFENVEIDGRPAEAPKDIKAVLGMTFPVMARAEDANGEPAFDDNGVPKYEMQNWPFAVQVSEVAGDYENFSGSSSDD